MKPTDKQMLDFLEKTAWSAGMNFDKKIGKYKCWVGNDLDGYGGTIRSAIGKAMRKHRKEAK